MSTIFPKWVNRIPLFLVLFGAIGAVSAVGAVWYYFSPRYLEVGYQPEQPVPYSHKLHAGTLGIDCRYCHTGVEVGDHANIPPTSTCMNCHKVIKPDSPQLVPVQESYADDRPIDWVRVNHLPDFAHFPHNAHVNAGVGCVECHGRVDQMDKVSLVEPLNMGWCLDCHRNPAPRIRPVDKVTQMDYVAQDPNEGEALVRLKNINPPENCSACHY